MGIRKELEAREMELLSPFAAKSALSKGREIPEQSCDIRTDFQRDRDRIIHSKAFRRLKDKMQVFIAPAEDHIRTRLLHTLEVSQIARTISRALNLNEDLTEAIALGHDLGHTPFGHGGEYALNRLSPYGFEHNQQSLRVARKLERSGRGLRLTHETLDGILNHRTGMNPATLEGKVVQLSDKIAYLNHDIDDAINFGIIHADDIPPRCIETLGNTSRQRINAMIRAVITSSSERDDVQMLPEIFSSMNELRDFMFQNVYMAESRLKEREKITHIISELYHYYLNSGIDELKDFAQSHGISDDPIEVVACDYIAGMTDKYCHKKVQEIFLPYYSALN